MKLARFYSDDELSEIRVTGEEETVFEVKNLFASEKLEEDAIRDMIRTRNSGQISHVDELRLDFNRLYRKRDLQAFTRYGLFALKDSASYQAEFSVDTILNIKNEQRYLSACFSDYYILKPRLGAKNQEPYLIATLRQGYFYLVNADELPSSNPFRIFYNNVRTWLRSVISFKTSTK